VLAVPLLGSLTPGTLEIYSGGHTGPGRRTEKKKQEKKRHTFFSII
jgi:hypothetical protein